MPDDTLAHRSRIPLNYNNVVTPQTSRTSLNLPRRPSGSITPGLATGSPISATHTFASNGSPNRDGPSTPASSIPSFRSLRNLLSFRPTPSASSNGGVPASPANQSKHSFVNFGSIRRSMTVERKNSGTFGRSEEDLPVISIEKPKTETQVHSEKPDPELEAAHSPSRGSVDSHRPVLPSLSPGSPLGKDLSTILEAENSGISKYIPELDETSCPTSPVSPSRPILDGLYCMRSADSRDASVLDLSTSKLKAEVMDAFLVKDANAATDWLKGVDGVVVEETTPISGDASEAEDWDVQDGHEGDTTFNFGELDPDLATLLSPNRVQPQSTQHNSILATFHSTLPSISPRLRLATPSWVPSPLSSPEKSSMNSTFTQTGVSSLVSAQSSPVRRSVSLSRNGPSRPIIQSSLPRLMRSATGVSIPLDVDIAGRKSSSDQGECPVPPATIKRRHQPPSPLSSTGYSTASSSKPKPYGLNDSSARRAPQSRLVTPSRHAPVYTPTPRPFRSPEASSGYLPARSEAESTSPSSSDPAQESPPLQRPRPSLDSGIQVDPNKKRRAHLFYNRKRSMSVEETRFSPASASSHGGAPPEVRPSSSLSNRPPVEWLGPRTAKAFAAAGLLDPDRDPRERDGQPSRFGSIRTTSESRYAPSRIASEVGSTSSWSRSRNGSVSRTMTPSDAGVAWTSSTFSAPRTTFSGSSAPTSISASSSAPAVQLLREKHELETGALLAALSDSQRSSKVLRDENSQLRERICVLEKRVETLLEQLHQRPQSSPMLVVPSFSRTVYDRTAVHPYPPVKLPPKPPLQRHHSALAADSLERQNPAASSSSINISRSHNASRRTSTSGTDTIELSTSPNPFDPTPKTQQRRSADSSIFPSLPNNMSMLMHEDAVSERAGAFSCRSISPPSPTLARTQRDSIHRTSAGTHHGNISPATASFCMTEMTGSPGSLHLRPEHELHLGDMASVDFGHMNDGEEEDFDS